MYHFKNHVTITEAAGILGLTRKAILEAARTGRLHFEPGARNISLEELARFKRLKYSREKALRSGEYTVRQAAIRLGIPEQKVYRLIRAGKLAAIRRGKKSFRIPEDEMQKRLREGAAIVIDRVRSSN